MNNEATLRELADQLMIRQFGASQDPEELALAAVAVYTQLLTRVSALVGDIGSPALFRRSVRLMEHAFPFYAAVRVAEVNGPLDAVEACLRTQSSELAIKASVALLAGYLELLSTFIGERLTRQLIAETWPDLGTHMR